MIGFHRNFPQAPRNRTVMLTERIAYPTIAPLSSLVVGTLALDFSLRTAKASSNASMERLAGCVSSEPPQTSEYPGFLDELAQYIDEREQPNQASTMAKVRTEFAVYSRLVGRLPAFSQMDEREFLEFLFRTHARLGKGINRFRDGPVAIRPDAAGNKVVFPHQRHCRPLMERLHLFLSANATAYPTLCATVAYGAVIHAHPFSDGNGRTARTIFNLVLAAAMGTRHFVPIHVIAANHRGSFLIKLRRALYGGDWAGLQAFLRDATRLSIRLQSDELHLATGQTARTSAHGPNHILSSARSDLSF